MKLTPNIPVLVFALVVGSTVVAHADDSNYQTYVIGERAMGMGGAYTAMADSAGGEFYNPAGPALLSGTSASLSQTVYSYQHRSYKDALTTVDGAVPAAQDLSDSQVPVIPASMSLAVKFGGLVADTKQFTAGYSMFVPQASEFSFRGILDFTTPAGRDDELRIDLQEKDRTLQHGPTIAMRIDPRWSVGLSIFHVYRTVETITSGYRVAVPQADDNLTDFARTVDSTVERSVHSLLFKVGGKFDLDRNWRFGLALTAPSIRLFGSGTADITNVSSIDDPNCYPNCTRFRTVIAEGDNADSRTPFNVRGGAGFTTDDQNLTVALDLSVHLPISYYPFDPAVVPMFLPDPSTGDLPAGYAVVEEIKRKTVVNLNIGSEYFLGDWLLRGGFYTNFSSAPEIKPGPFAQPSNVDMYGISAAFGYRFPQALVSIGAIYAFGSGQVSGIRTPQPGEDPRNIFGPHEERRDYVFVFLQGTGTAIKKGADTAKDFILGPSEEGPAEPATPSDTAQPTDSTEPAPQ